MYSYDFNFEVIGVFFVKSPLYVLIYEEQIIFVLKESSLIQEQTKNEKRNYINKIILMGGVTKGSEVKYWSYVKKKYKLNVTNFLYA